MATHDPASEQRPTLREDHRRRTTERIIDATSDLVRERGSVEFTMADVAGRAGVALRTLHRYYPRRQDLVDALATVSDQTDVGVLPSGLDDIEPWIAGAWRNLLDDEALLRAQHLGQAGTEVRRSRTPRHRAVTRRFVETVRPDLTPSQCGDLVEVTLMLTSSTTMFEFVDVLDADVDEAARIVATALRTLIVSTGIDTTGE